MPGFKLDELMVGSHRFVGPAAPGRSAPLLFHITWGTSHLGRFFNPWHEDFMKNELLGFITVGHLVKQAPCQGTLRLEYFTRRRICYDLFFEDGAGRPYHYEGRKTNLWPWNLHKTHFTCYGTITDLTHQRVISESVVYFPYRQIWSFVSSFRLRRGDIFHRNCAGQ